MYRSVETTQRSVVGLWSQLVTDANQFSLSLSRALRSSTGFHPVSSSVSTDIEVPVQPTNDKVKPLFVWPSLLSKQMNHSSSFSFSSSSVLFPSYILSAKRDVSLQNRFGVERVRWQTTSVTAFSLVILSCKRFLLMTLIDEILVESKHRRDLPATNDCIQS